VLFKTVIASEAKQSMLLPKIKMDCFVAFAPRNDGKTRLRNPTARFARVLPEFSALEIRGRGECRVPSAPAAARGVKNTRVSHRRSPEITRHSRTQWF
jgi:hypothetical protein